jgi:hypothetical protein
MPARKRPLTLRQWHLMAAQHQRDYGYAYCVKGRIGGW